MSSAFWLSFRELTKRPLGTAIAVSVITLAVAFAAGLELVARAREAAVAADLDNIGPAIRIIPHGKTSRDLARFDLKEPSFSDVDIRRLRSEYRSFVSSIEGRLSLKVSYGGRLIPVVGILPESVITPFDIFRNLKDDQALIGSELASTLGIGRGETLHLKGQSIKVLAALPPMASQDDSAVFVHITRLQQMFNLSNVFNELRIYPTPGANVDELADLIAAGHASMTALTADRGKTAEQSMQASLRDHRRVLYIVTGVVIAISVLIWSYMNGIERRLELATLVAVGGSAWTVVSMILMRGTLLGVSGAILGFLAGVAISFGQDAGSTMRILPAIDLLGITIATTTILSAVGAVPAAALAAIQDPARTLQTA